MSTSLANSACGSYSLVQSETALPNIDRLCELMLNVGALVLTLGLRNSHTGRKGLDPSGANKLSGRLAHDSSCNSGNCHAQEQPFAATFQRVFHRLDKEGTIYPSGVVLTHHVSR